MSHLLRLLANDVTRLDEIVEAKNTPRRGRKAG
jgi:hypothetical protein